MHAKTQMLTDAHNFNFGKTFNAAEPAGSTVANPFRDSPGPDTVPSRQRPPSYKYAKTMTGDDKDKAYALESENFDLKQKENFLEEKIVLMRTKLRRIEELLSKRAMKQQEKTGGLSGEVQDSFAAEIRQMSSENDHLRE